MIRSSLHIRDYWISVDCGSCLSEANSDNQEGAREVTSVGFGVQVSATSGTVTLEVSPLTSPAGQVCWSY